MDSDDNGSLITTTISFNKSTKSPLKIVSGFSDTLLPCRMSHFKSALSNQISPCFFGPWTTKQKRETEIITEGNLFITYIVRGQIRWKDDWIRGRIRGDCAGP
jgi:hypothetical protein